MSLFAVRPLASSAATSTGAAGAAEAPVVAAPAALVAGWTARSAGVSGVPLLVATEEASTAHWPSVALAVH
ncbi:hypothetical protein GCM10023321_50660 [Pseudonocardia eucalypti]|uniref:Secreted protein n=1 Tax=Pseudonocardia eucalypti TaxID=648755 RepID=A0ABP9QKM8_9PSEU